MSSKLKTLGVVTLASAGTRQKLTATSTLAERVHIMAGKSNSGDVVIGDVTVTAANGFILDANERLELSSPMAGGGSDLMDLSEIYLDGGSTNDTIRVLYIQKQN